jgi:hypothetical protein
VNAREAIFGCVEVELIELEDCGDAICGKILGRVMAGLARARLVDATCTDGSRQRVT